MDPKDLPAIETLIPHRAPMRLIDSVLFIDDDQIRTVSTVKETWPLSDRYGADVILMVEMIAQSVAALYHRRTKRPGEPQIDFLVGIKEARFSVPRLPMKAELTVAVEIVTTVGNYGLFKGEVMHGDKCFCETLVQVLEPGEDLWETLVKGRVEEVTAPE